MNGIDLIQKERERQISEEGWSANHDDGHTCGELAKAAMCYADPGPHFRTGSPAGWPWAWEYWNPTPNDPIRELVRAGALIAAEIDRLERLES